MYNNTADDIGKLVLRLTLGILILLHGIAKLLHGVDPILGMVEGIGLPGALGYAVLIGEVLAPVLLILGFYGRIGAALIAINMAVAVLLGHRADFFTITPHGGWALELQAMFFFTAVALVLTGMGRLSLNDR